MKSTGELRATDRARLLSIVGAHDDLRFAVDTADAQCLRAHGVVPAATAPQRPPESPNLVDAIGIFQSAKQAETRGYRAFRGAPSPSTKDPSSTKSYRIAEYGKHPVDVTYRAPSSVKLTTSDGGCFSESVKSVYGSLRRYLIVTSLEPVMDARPTLTTSIVTPIYRDYSTCMKSAGVETQSLSDTLHLASTRFRLNGPISSAEVQMAERDERCQSQVHLLDRFNRGWLLVNKRWVTTHSAYLQEQVTVLKIARERASVLVNSEKSGGGGSSRH